MFFFCVFFFAGRGSMLHERVALCETLRAVNSSRGLDCSTITPPGGSCDKWQGCPSVQQPVFGTDVSGRSGREKVPRVQQESLRRKTLSAHFFTNKNGFTYRVAAASNGSWHKVVFLGVFLVCFFLNVAKTTEIMKLRFIICDFALGLVVFSQADLRQLFLGRLSPSLVNMDKLGSNDH